ncbi:MAG: hypothetical protein ACJ8DC_06540 [Gemmatimonadales bacterium]
MKTLALLVFGTLAVAGMAGGRLAGTAATEVAATPKQGPECALTQGADPQGGPAPLPRAKAARGQATTRTPRYISHMKDAHVVVFDTSTRQVVGRIPGTPGVTGVFVVGELRKLYASVTGRRYVAYWKRRGSLSIATTQSHLTSA